MHILLAEDDPKLLKSLIHIFRNNRYITDGVSNGADAFNYAATGEYDGIVMDIMMPEKDGLMVLRELREQNITTPVLLLTARTEIPQRIEGLDAGADDYLPKPFAAAELMARVRAMLRRKSNYTPDILSARQLNGAMDMLADRISENGGSFPEYSAGEQEDMGGPAPGFINEETRFSVRFFIVSFDDEGLVTGENIAAMRSVTQQSAAGYGIKAAASGSERGWIDDYRYKKYENSQGYDIVFVDGAMNRSVFRMTMLSAGAALTGSGIVLFILMVVFSKRAVRPIAESYEKQKQFITDANHELKTPLTLIMTNIDIVQSEIGENEWLQDAKCEGSRMNDLINQMGILTKMDEGADGGEKARLDLSGLVTEKARSFVPLAESRNKKLMAAIDGGTVCIGHRQAVEKLMDILFDNAIKYCDEGGTITVALRNRRRPLLTVENTYRSAQNVETDKLFDRFYRGDRSRTPSGGFGIGLSIAKAIVKDQGGEINAYIKSGDIVGFKVVFR